MDWRSHRRRHIITSGFGNPVFDLHNAAMLVCCTRDGVAVFSHSLIFSYQSTNFL